MERMKPFKSLRALCLAHSRLKRRRYESGLTTRLLRDIVRFVERGALTGLILERDDDRWYAQSLLDYWANVLYRAHWPEPDATLASFQPQLIPVGV